MAVKNVGKTTPTSETNKGTETPPVQTTQPVETPNYDEKIKSFEDTISKQGETISQLEQVINGFAPVVDTLVNNETLRQQFQTTYQGRYGVPNQQPQQTNQPPQTSPTPTTQTYTPNREVTELVTERRDDIIRAFEKDYGLDQLSKEEKAEATQKIASYLSDFNWSVTGKDGPQIPVTMLRSSLEKAYMGSIGIDKLREEGKLEGSMMARANAQGVMGTFPSGAPQFEDTGNLTSKQSEWIKKLRVDEEKAKKTYADRGNEESREKGNQ